MPSNRTTAAATWPTLSWPSAPRRRPKPTAGRCGPTSSRSWKCPPDVWLDGCRGFLQEGLTYISLPELDGDTVVKKSVRLDDILATIDQIADGHGDLDA